MPPDWVSVPYSPSVSRKVPLACMDEIAEGPAGVDGDVAGAVDAQRGLPGGRPAQAEDARRGSGRRSYDTKVRSMASDRLPGVGSEASTAEVSVVVGNDGVGLRDQERPEAADVADLGRGFAEAAEVGRGLGQGGVVGIGRRADHGQQVVRR